jgi:hypothetical protein
MIVPNPPRAPLSEQLAKQYELLRSRVISGAGSGSHTGMVLLRRSGVAAWMRQASSADERPTPLRGRRDAGNASVGSELPPGLVRVLANMAMGHRGSFA